MKDLIEIILKYLLVIFGSLTILIGVVNCQKVYESAQPKLEQDVHPDHKTIEDFEDTIGYKTVTAISKDHRLLFYKKEVKLKVFLGSFGYDKLTRFDDDKWEGRYYILYCKTHNFAYIVSPFKEKKQ